MNKNIFKLISIMVFVFVTLMSQCIIMRVHVLCGKPMIKYPSMQLFVPLSLKQFITLY